jgi:hypothetical protein
MKGGAAILSCQNCLISPATYDKQKERHHLLSNNLEFHPLPSESARVTLSTSRKHGKQMGFSAKQILFVQSANAQILIK